MKSARQEILEKLSESPLDNTTSEPDCNLPIYKLQSGSLIEQFISNFENLSGKVHLFENEYDLFNKLQQFIKNKNWEFISCLEPSLQEKLLAAKIDFNPAVKLQTTIEIGITSCEFLAADTGSVVVSSAQTGSRQVFVYPPVHIVVTNTNQLIDTLENAYQLVLNKYINNFPSLISIISGPSRTADIEKTLVMGAHGPKSLIVFISR